MNDKQLSRRKVLGALATTGGAGALVGTGTSALFTDEETFANNSISASESVAGSVELEVDVDPLSDAEGVKYSVNLPEGVNNNPSHVWVRAKTCPDPLSSADELEVELRLECNGSTVTLERGQLLSVINALRGGRKVECGGSNDGQCFQPGESADLVLEVLDVDSGAAPRVEFVFEFYAEQCRYNIDPDNPFDPSPDCERTPGHAISFIGFCSESGEPLEPEITQVNSRSDGEPTSVDWETGSDVDYVVVKSGQNFTIYSSNSNNRTAGTATTGGDPAADFYGRVSGSVEDGFTGGQGDKPGRGNRAAAEPCELAADIVGDGNFPDDGTSTKLDRVGGDWEKQEEGGKQGRKKGKGSGGGDS